MEPELPPGNDPLATLFADDLFASGSGSGMCRTFPLIRPPADVSMFVARPAVSEPTREDGDSLSQAELDPLAGRCARLGI